MLFIAGVLSCGGGAARRAQQPQATDEMVGEATGIASIFDNDKALARDRAIDDAMNKLVKAKLGTTVTGRSLVQDFALVESIIEASSTGMVKDWKVKEEHSETDAYFVTITGRVFPAAVNETIEATIKNYGRPKFMVLVQESYDGVRNEPGNTVTELTMMQLMGNQGFDFVDSQMTKDLLRKERKVMGKALRGTVGRRCVRMSCSMTSRGAEVIIFGPAKTTDQTAAHERIRARNMKSKQANVQLKAVRRLYAAGSSRVPG
jgi:hypothetical protein